VAAPLNFHLPHYEGPLDLLLELVRKQGINIWDIPIAQITQQYLAYIHQAVELNIELASEFVFMAATLIHIKSRMLLPRSPGLEQLLPDEDPRKELVERLLEHERFKSAAEMLHQKRIVEEAAWSNPQIARFREGEEDPGLAVTLFDLVRTLQQVLERAKSRPVFEVEDEGVSVPDMMRYLRELFSAARKPIAARDLFERQGSRRAMICLFLAILELVKLQALGLTQGDTFGEIGLKRLKGFDAAFAADGVVPYK
jgi:segregation and condensation protein A